MNFRFNRLTLIPAVALACLLGVHSNDASRQLCGQIDQSALQNNQLQPMFNAARQADLNGNLQVAVQGYRQLLSQAPNHARAHHRLAVVLDQLDRADLAAQHYQRALALTPQNAELLCDCGFSMYLQGRHEKSLEFLNAAFKINPGDERIRNNLNLVREAQNNAAQNPAAQNPAAQQQVAQQQVAQNPAAQQQAAQQQAAQQQAAQQQAAQQQAAQQQAAQQQAAQQQAAQQQAAQQQAAQQQAAQQQAAQQRAAQQHLAQQRAAQQRAAQQRAAQLHAAQQRPAAILAQPVAAAPVKVAPSIPSGYKNVIARLSIARTHTAAQPVMNQQAPAAVARTQVAAQPVRQNVAASRQIQHPTRVLPKSSAQMPSPIPAQQGSLLMSDSQQGSRFYRPNTVPQQTPARVVQTGAPVIGGTSVSAASPATNNKPNSMNRQDAAVAAMANQQPIRFSDISPTVANPNHAGPTIPLATPTASVRDHQQARPISVLTSQDQLKLSSQRLGYEVQRPQAEPASFSIGDTDPPSAVALTKFQQSGGQNGVAPIGIGDQTKSNPVDSRTGDQLLPQDKTSKQSAPRNK